MGTIGGDCWCLPGGLKAWPYRSSLREGSPIQPVHQRARVLCIVLSALAALAGLFLGSEVAYGQSLGQVSVVSGNGQTGQVGTTLPDPLSVQVLIGTQPVPGAIIQWQIQQGGGTLSTTSSTTDAAGQASTTLTLGPSPGTNTVTATCTNDGIDCGSVTFTETAQAPPTTIAIVSGNNQTAQVSTALPNPLVVQVLSGTQPVAGATIQWQVAQGGGSLSSTSSTTNANGQASTMLTLGPSPGTNTVVATATVNGASVGSVTFSATAQQQPATIQIVSGNGQTGQVTTALPNPLVIQVLAGTQPVAGATVQWQVTGGGGSLSSTTSTTDANGRASTTLTLGPNPGTNTVATTATVSGASIGSVTFTATGQAQATPTAGSLQKVSGDNQNLIPGTAADLVVKVVGTNDQPLPGVQMNWSVSPPGAGKLAQATTTTGSDGQTHNTITVGAPQGLQVIASALGQSTTFNLNTGLTFGPALNEAQRAIARTIDIVCPSGKAGPDLQARCNEFIANQSTSPGAVANALQQVSPDKIAAQSKSSIEFSNIQFGNIGSRLAALRAGVTGLSLGRLALNFHGNALPGGDSLASLTPSFARGGAASADEPSQGGRLGVFVNGRGDFGSKDATGRESGFDFTTGGVTAGVDYRITNRAILGLAFGYASTSADLDNSGGNQDMKSYSASIYGTYYQSERFYVDGIASIGRNNFDSTRNVRYQIPTSPGSTDITTVNQSFAASNDGLQYSFSLGAGYDLHRGGLTFGPYARLSYVRAEIDGFDESPSGPTPGNGWAVHVNDLGIESLTTSLGGQTSYAISHSWGVLVPQGRLEWVHEFKRDSRLLTGNFIQDAGQVQFGLSTDEPSRDYANLGLGVSAVFAHGRSAFLNYERSLGQSDITTNSITAGIRLEF